MRRAIYLSVLFVVTIWILATAIALVVSIFAAGPRLIPYLSVDRLIAHPLPFLIGGALEIAFLFLIVRRFRIFAREREMRAPDSFTLIPLVLSAVSVASLALAALVTAGAVLLKIHQGAGLLAGLLAMPAVFLLVPVLAWVEFRSLKLGQRPQAAAGGPA